MFKKQTLAGMVIAGSAGMLALAPQADAGLLTFDNVTDWQAMTGSTYGSTPEVAVSYDGPFLQGWASAWYPVGDGASGGAIYNGNIDRGTVQFAAIAGYTVRLDSLVLRVGSGNSSDGILDYSLDEGTTWVEVPTSIPAGSTSLIEFTGVEASVVQIRWSDSQVVGVGPEADVALDNIAFTAVPEPGSLALLGLGGLALLRRRRSA